jgi:hypothetical protein
MLSTQVVVIEVCRIVSSRRWGLVLAVHAASVTPLVTYIILRKTGERRACADEAVAGGGDVMELEFVEFGGADA